MEDKRWSMSVGASRTAAPSREKPAGQESGAEFKDDPKAGPASGRRGGESRPEAGTTDTTPKKAPLSRT